MRVALIQMTSTDEPGENAGLVRHAVTEAAESGAELIVTPEVTNCVSLDRDHQMAVIGGEDSDPVLAEARRLAAERGVWILLGSLALKVADDERLANRSILVSPEGIVAARYDKIHMFDVDISESETFRESAGFRPGSRAVAADAGDVRLGLTICYDLRFPHLYRRLAKAGCRVLTVPAAFSPETGRAHWETLLRARAIETGCFVLAPAQCGVHPARQGRPRGTHGHTLAVDPWGTVLLDGGSERGVHILDMDLSLVEDARQRVPSLSHDRSFDGP